MVDLSIFHVISRSPECLFLLFPLPVGFVLSTLSHKIRVQTKKPTSAIVILIFVIILGSRTGLPLKKLPIEPSTW